MGSSAAGLLVFTMWITGGLGQLEENGGTAVAALGIDSATTPSPTTTRPTTTTKAPASTTKPRPTTTTTVAPETTKQAVRKPAPKPSPKPTPPPPPPPESCSTALDGTEPHVAQVGNHLLGKFAVDSVIGRASRSGASDHPSGLALDFMVDTATGDALAEYVLAHQSEFAVSYVIWRQRYNDGGGWSMMEDRGSATANHYDHVHVSFEAGGDVDVAC
ncbi:hypothetical protein B0I33_103591 [Prauserella shujinwangii]|uniref:ARB-07466-like C-terminal domain-containing protein n=1 Tax=Prauserella shujinwangii TaxID=1453103 RepID=A0A2T0LZL8_9PSEU|nr:hypothetical protein [Prauserella shujinwangii]PRX49554.1 hypothetical protein B0I33_103591 [Prauserella shujinwangii]